MLKRSLLPGILAILAMLASSCIFDPKPAPPGDDGGGGQNYVKKALTDKEAVLNNIQYAYNKRNITAYDELLDSDFTFFLFPGDVGENVPEQWGRTDEILANTRLFDPNYPGPNRCKKIDFDLQFEDGVQWVEVLPASHPDETWYQTTVVYNFTIDVEPDTQFSPEFGSSAQFTVRNVGTDTDQQWRLVEFRDLAAQ